MTEVTKMFRDSPKRRKKIKSNCS